MKKVLLHGLVVLGLIALFALVALLRGGPEPLPGENAGGSGRIRKVLASGIKANVRLLSIGRRRGSASLPASIARAELPTGLYRPENLSLEATQGGHNWRLNSYGPWGRLGEIRIERDVTTDLIIGPPLTIKTDVRDRGESVLVGLAIFGRANERYHPGVRKNRRRQAPPTLKIVDEAGNVLASGKFEYG